MHWALQLADDFLHHILTPSYATELAICGKEAVNKLQNAARDIINLSPGLDSSQELHQIIERAYISLLASRAADQFQWRRLYSDASVLCSLMDLTSPQALSEEIAMSCVARLDHALIIAGAPGQGVQALIHDLILRTQAEHLPRRPFQSTFKPATRPTRSPPTHSLVLPSSFAPIPRLIDPPSLSIFCRELLDKPFILTGFASDWPAMNDRPWHSIDYLRSVAGRGRVVPVEVGKDYRTDDWAQRMMSWDDFLHVLEDPTRSQTILYLAQHNLLSQFPALREDILIPDYVFSAPQAPATCPFYRPPNNEEELILNAWLGPAGTVSPAHTDPFFNLYSKRPFPSIPAQQLRVLLCAHSSAYIAKAQVVGRKTIWLAPPTSSITQAMYPYTPPSTASDTERTRNPTANLLAPSMTNTAQVDVFSDQNKDKFPLFWQDAVPEAMSAILEPGDVLFFPPGWWHAMRSEEMSFSVSIWF